MNPVRRFRDADPVLHMAMGLAPAILGATGLADGIAIGGATAFAIAASSLAAPFVRRAVDARFMPLAVAALSAFAAAAWSLGVQILAPAVWSRVLPFLSLASANALVVSAALASGEDEELARYPAKLLAATRFLGATLALAAVRELLATGGLSIAATAAARAVAAPLRLAGLPAGAFILIGLGLAATRAVRLAASRYER